MASDAPSHSPRFFVLEKLREVQHDTEFSPVNLQAGSALRCPQCGGIIGLLTWQPPHQGELELHGGDFGDVVMGPCGGLLITERFAEDFKAEGLTGLSGFHPVEVIRVARRKRRAPNPSPPPGYLFVMPAYGHPALDMERSRIRSSKPMRCPACLAVGPDAINGLSVEAATWNGDVWDPLRLY